LQDLQDSGSSTTEPKAQEAWQKLPYVLDGKNCYAQKFKKPGKNYQLHSIQHLLLIGVAWFRETIRSYPFFRMYPRKTSGVSEYYLHAILLHVYCQYIEKPLESTYPFLFAKSSVVKILHQ
jgi:hypothetical protein